VGGRLPAGRVVGVRTAAERDAARCTLPPGPLAATIVVAGLPVGELAPGTRLRAGGAVLELAGGAAAAGVQEAEAGTPPRAARVVEAGTVAAGDPVAIDAVALPLEDWLDLHPFAPADVPDVVTEYLARARAAGLTEVRLVHGRGRGVQREAVRRVLSASPLVLAFADAAPEAGGWGATVARLRPPDPSA